MMIARLLTEPAFGERERGIGHYLSKKYRHNTDSVEGSIKHCEEIVLTFGDLRSAPGGHPNSPTCGRVKLPHLT
jgi:hypothetical protein